MEIFRTKFILRNYGKKDGGTDKRTELRTDVYQYNPLFQSEGTKIHNETRTNTEKKTVEAGSQFHGTTSSSTCILNMIILACMVAEIPLTLDENFHYSTYGKKKRN